jgi:hypothetical protein
MYVWAEKFAVSVPAQSDVQTLDLDSVAFREYLKIGRISSETLYGVTSPSWDGLQKEKQEEILGKMLQAGKDKGYRRVSLLNPQGKVVGYAGKDRIEVY